MAEVKSYLVTTKELAQLFQVTTRTVEQLAKQEILPVKKRRPYTFDIWEAASAYIAYLREKIQGREAKAASSPVTEKLQAEADLKRAKADIAALQLSELQGKMHRSEDVEDMTNDLVYSVRGMIMALPGRLAMDIVQAENAAEASAMIRAECHKILNELAGYQYDPDAYRQRVREREGWGDAIADGDDE